MFGILYLEPRQKSIPARKEISARRRLCARRAPRPPFPPPHGTQIRRLSLCDVKQKYLTTRQKRRIIPADDACGGDGHGGRGRPGGAQLPVGFLRPAPDRTTAASCCACTARRISPFPRSPEQMSITRQGVSDAIRKARAQLESYEEKLGLVGRYLAIDRQARACMRRSTGSARTTPARWRARDRRLKTSFGSRGERRWPSRG